MASFSSKDGPAMGGKNLPPKKELTLGSDKRDTHAPTEAIHTNLANLLAEPEVRMVMRADGVNEHELLAMLGRISAKLLQNAARSDCDERGQYRPGVGIVLLNMQGQILVGHRADIAENAWQLPQGGIQRGEDPHGAALRELMEELGTDNVEVVAESRDWLSYDVPPEQAQKAWAGYWQGQRQKWFVMLFKGQDSDFDLTTERPEFCAWRWVPPCELPTLAVPFKRELYLSILREFEAIFPDKRRA